MSKKTDLYNRVPVKKVPRNFFDLSHEVKMSGKFGFLYPVLLQEAMPGDSFHNTTTAMVRFAPMLSPIMHRVNVKFDFFFVPMRLLMPQQDWEDFITGGQNGTDTVVMPFVTPANIVSETGSSALLKKGTLWDYMGLPVLEGADPGAFNQQEISFLPFRAYMQIYNDWFRDPNLDTEVDLHFENGADNSSNFDECGVLKRRGWERDQFTSALPWAQRGEEVLMPMEVSGSQVLSTSTGDPAAAGKFLGIDPGLAGSLGTATTFNPTTGFESAEVVLENASTTINDLRTALAIQSWLENNARGGARYIEQIESHYRVRVPDYRLQRSEYLGGGRQPVEISQVLSTADAGDAPVGDMAGHGISVGRTNRFRYRCQEHGYIIGIMSIVPTTAYFQGVNRLWLRQNKFDFAFPELAHLGEQEMKNMEIFFSFSDTGDAANKQTFGYVPRYYEYKTALDRVSGDFRDTLLFWHLSRKFTARPSLDSSFVTMIEDNTAEEETYRRIFAVQDGTDYLWCQLFHSLTAKRPLPYFGIPKLVG